MTLFIYENTKELLNSNGQLLRSVEINAHSQDDADEIYRGYDGERAENKMRDLHV